MKKYELSCGYDLESATSVEIENIHLDENIDIANNDMCHWNDNNFVLGFCFGENAYPGIVYVGDDDTLITIKQNDNTVYNHLLFASETEERRVVSVVLKLKKNIVKSTDIEFSNFNPMFVELPKMVDTIELKFNGTNSKGIIFYGLMKSCFNMILSSLPCFTGDTILITTVDGYKNITTIKPGDKLIDGFGKIVTVKNIWYKTCFYISEHNDEIICPYVIDRDRFGVDRPFNRILISPHCGIYKRGMKHDMCLGEDLDLEQINPVLPFVYYNIELEEGIGTIIVNGIIFESYCSDNNKKLIIKPSVSLLVSSISIQ
jgi:hypothetical protein